MKEIKKVGTTALQELLEEVVELSKEGYIFHPKRQIRTLAQRTGNFSYAAYMFKPEEVEAEEKVETQQEEPVEDITTKAGEDDSPSIEEMVDESIKELEEALKDNAVVEFDAVEALVELDGITKKDDLLAFAEKLGIAIPEDMKYPKQISAYIRKELEGDNKDETQS